MSVKDRKSRDAFTFSLGGLSAKTPYLALQAIAEDRINKAIDERLRRSQDDQPETAREMPGLRGRFWLSKRRRAA